MTLPPEKQKIEGSRIISLRELCFMNNIRGWEEISSETVEEAAETLGYGMNFWGNTFYRAPENEEAEIKLMERIQKGRDPGVLIFHRRTDKIPSTIKGDKETFEVAHYELFGAPLSDPPSRFGKGKLKPFSTLEEIGTVFRAAIMRSFF